MIDSNCVLPHIASTCPFQYSFEAVNLWMVERFAYVQRAHCSNAPLFPHEMPIVLSVNRIALLLEYYHQLFDMFRMSCLQMIQMIHMEILTKLSFECVFGSRGRWNRFWLPTPPSSGGAENVPQT